MNVYLLTEPTYTGAKWCRETVEGISRRAAALRYPLYAVSTQELTREMRLLLVLGTSPAWTGSVLRQMDALGLKAVLVNQEGNGASGVVMLDYPAAVRESLYYLRETCKREKIALYGVNPASSSDREKAVAFGREDVFYNTGSLESCYASFATHVRQFDGVLCVNHIAALSLIKQLHSRQIRIPEELMILTFGDSELGSLLSLSCVTLDFMGLGEQAVRTYAFLLRQPEEARLKITLPCRILPGGSTSFLPAPGRLGQGEERIADNLFFDDPEVIRTQRTETLLSACDELDKQILRGLMNGKTMEELAQELFSSVSGIRYRIRRLREKSEASSRGELLELLREYSEDPVL